MLCLFCGECCRLCHPKIYDDTGTGCNKLRTIGTFSFCKSYFNRPYSCVIDRYLSHETYCPFGMKILGLTIDQARERRKEGLKLIEELYGEKHGKRFNGWCQIN